MTEYVSAWWVLEIPKHWYARDDAECVTFVPDTNIGALQISAYKKGGEVTDEDLIEFSGDLSGCTEHKRLKIYEFSGFTVIYSEGETYWKRWWLRSGEIMIFATYNCDLKEANRHADEVESIISTLKEKK